MKHISRIILLGAAVIAFAACQKDDRATVKLSQETQCSKASSVISRAIDLVSPNYFINTVNTINDLEDALKNNDGTEITKFKEELEKGWTSETKKDIQGVSTTIEQWVISLEDVTGKFTLNKEGKWVREDAKNFQIIWNDKDGIACKLTFNASDGRNTELFVKDCHNDGYGPCQDLTYLVVPGTVSVKLTRGNSTLVSGLVTTTSKFKNTECFYDGAKLSSAASVNAEGVEFLVTRFKFTTDEVIVKSSIYNGTKKVANTKIKLEDLIWKAQEDGDMDIRDLESCKKATIEGDILGEMQIKGTLRPDEISAAEDLAFANRLDEAKFKEAVSKINKALDVKVYFDGFTKNDQGCIEYLPVFDSEYGYWESKANYKFADGSGYMSADDFFFSSAVTNHFGLFLTDLGVKVLE